MPPAKVQYKPVEIGDIYNNLEVVGYAGRIKKGKKNQKHWYCKCVCGNPEILIIDEMNLKNGGTKSCGCLMSKNIKKAKLKTTFYDWCVSNNKEWILDLWDNELNDVSPKEISYTTHSKYYFKCKEYKINHPSIKHAISDITTQTNLLSCPYCNCIAQYLIDLYGEDALEKYWDYEKNTVDPWLTSKAGHIKVWIKCQDVNYHESYEVMCSDFYMGNRCPYCNSKKVHLYDSLGYKYPIAVDMWSDKNNKSPYEYSIHSNKKVWWKCPEGLHDDFYKTITDMVRDNFHCVECSSLLRSSNLQEKVYNYLTELGYVHVIESDCSLVVTNPNTNRRLLFDNEVCVLKLLIEVHGVQHYKITHFAELHAKQYGITPQESLEDLQWRDNYKMNYALQNGYRYLIVPYWTECDESYKTLIDEKIAEIITLN